MQMPRTRPRFKYVLNLLTPANGAKPPCSCRCNPGRRCPIQQASRHLGEGRSESYALVGFRAAR